MLPLNKWNELAQASRSEICRIVGVSGQVENEYHHNFDYDALGKKVKSVLSCCNVQKNGTINVVVNVTPRYEGKKPKEKPATKKQQKAQEFIKAINASLSDAVRILPDILKTYGNKDRWYQIRVNSEWNYNHNVDYLEIHKGKLYADIYWQGDSTDGNDDLLITDILNGRGRIKAEYFDDGYRMRCTHGDIHVDREELYAAIKCLIPVIEASEGSK